MTVSAGGRADARLTTASSPPTRSIRLLIFALTMALIRAAPRQFRQESQEENFVTEPLFAEQQDMATGDIVGSVGLAQAAGGEILAKIAAGIVAPAVLEAADREQGHAAVMLDAAIVRLEPQRFVVSGDGGVVAHHPLMAGADMGMDLRDIRAQSERLLEFADRLVVTAAFLERIAVGYPDDRRLWRQRRRAPQHRKRFLQLQRLLQCDAEAVQGHGVGRIGGESAPQRPDGIGRTFFKQERLALVGEREGVVLVERQRADDGGARLAGPALFEKNRRQIVERRGIARRGLGGAAKGVRRGGEIALTAQDEAELLPQAALAGRELRRLPQAGGRADAVAAGLQRLGQIGVVERLARPDGDRLRDARLRALCVAALQSQHARQVQRIGLLGIGRDDPLVERAGFVVTAGLMRRERRL